MNPDLSLALEGSTYAGSAAIIRDGSVIAEMTLDNAPKPGRTGREEGFLPMVDRCLSKAGIDVGSLSRVVCGEGPGSFTSLRVAASIGKGIAVGAGIPMFAVSSLKLIVAGAQTSPGTWLAALPAMRGEVFVAPFEVLEDGTINQTAAASLVLESSLGEESVKWGGPAIGPGVGSEWAPHARGVARVMKDVLAGGPCDIDTWEPTYGRFAEAQVRWEASHGRPLTATG
ncbi:MAG TPA: tRNA (adenosine(37)-N6)-threonylcarbamoyltransferase complex dimerization subunit type 1 TsaB [Gemmatimonadaceae bacterium]|nr:tRNA (adenosine(37)-N6)-threonylcarbamoyltransferase complex dimerization subunit type 1 TsaB [Gemmatimonadaceae bacterium]